MPVQGLKGGSTRDTVNCTGTSFTFTRASKIINLAAEGQRGPAKPRSAASAAAAGAGDATEWPACVTSGAVDVRLTSIMNGAMRSSFHWSTQHVRWSWITARAAARVGTQQSTCRQCGLVRLRLPTPRSDYLHSLSPLLTLKALVLGEGRSFAKFVSKFAMLCIFPLREISCEI